MLNKLISIILLLVGISLAIVLTPTFLFFAAAPVALLALTVGQYQRYALDVWLGFDKFINAAMGGDHEETISSRLGKSIYHNSPSVFFTRRIDKVVASCLDVVDPDHCLKSIDWSVGRRYK